MILEGRACSLIRPQRYARTRTNQTTSHYAEALICYPFAVVLMQRWKAKHSYIDGRRLVFTGSALGLWGNWLKRFLLCIITIGIYSFWVAPCLTRWKWEHTDFDAAFTDPVAPGMPGMPATAA